MTTATATPGRPPAPPISERIRIARQVFREPAPALDELRRLGPVSELRLGPARLAFVGEPAAIRELLSMPADRFRWAHRYNAVGLKFVVGAASMIVSDGADHTRRRRVVQPAFTPRSVGQWAGIIGRRTDAALDELVAELPADGEVRNIYGFGRSLILGITVEAFFGERLAGRTAEIAALMEGPQAYIEAPAARQLPHPFPGTRRAKVRADRRQLDRIIDDEIAARRSSSSAGEPTGAPTEPDVLDRLLADPELSAAEVHDQAFTLIGAGYDTTAATLAWIEVELARHPELASRLRDEADRVLGGPGDQGADASALVEADRFVREILRLHPPGLLGVRLAAEDVVVAGSRIARGSLIVWSPYLSGRDPQHWDDPLRFDPDRFADLTPEQQQLADVAWVPFGRGPHKCLGFALAQLELVMITSRLAQRLDLEALDAAVPRPLGMVVNRPDGGVVVRVRARADRSV